MKVLIFDDVLVNKRDDYRITGLDLAFYPHADDAVAVVRKEQPAVVLMDYDMNDHRTGAEAISSLRAEFDRKDVAIIAISADTTWNEEMLDAGADDAMPKSHLRGYLSRLAQLRK